MEKEKLLNYIAPCSLLCYTCMSFKDGPSSTSAKKVYNYSDGWGEFYNTLIPEEKREEAYKEFSAFQNTLKFLGGASCPGCRNNPQSNKSGWGCAEGCVIPACVKEHGVDFCAECDEFPCQTCDNTGSKRIKEIGIEAYFEEMKDISHYIRYKKETE
ncbi:MAG: DUF3795 domain-containing protein [Oscillospiraceae bacterium]|nr:DUF3795 domain-containing protein [Oscillospiraceae bacterium]